MGTTGLRVSTAERAKFIVSFVTRPWVTTEKVGHAAVDRVAGWLSPDERSRFDRLVQQVEKRLDALPSHELGSPGIVEQAISTTQAHFAKAGLSIEDLVRRRLNRDEAVAEQQARFERTVHAREAFGPICRNHVIPAVIDGLFAEPAALAEIDLAFKRAVLEQKDEIRRLPDEVGEVLRGWLGSALLRDPAWTWQPGMAESALLQAEFAVVPFEPREDLMRGAKDWCALPAPLGIRLYVGPGGMGKTRFLMQRCRDLEPLGWRAGFLERLDAPLGAWLAESLFQSDQQTLAVVDYAENRPDDVVSLLEQAVRGPRTKVRIALVARGEGEWWDRLRRHSGLAQALLSGEITEPAIPVGSIAMDAPTRLICFQNAAAAFAKRLGRPKRRMVIEPDLTGEHFGRVLIVHMAALAIVEGHSIGTAAALHDHMLDREARTWERNLLGPKLGALDADDVLQAMAMIGFAGGADGLNDARALIGRAPRLQHQPRATLDDLARLLARLYPRVERARDRQELRIEPLRPDILGERLIQRALTHDPSLLEAVFAD